MFQWMATAEAEVLVGVGSLPVDFSFNASIILHYDYGVQETQRSLATVICCLVFRGSGDSEGNYLALCCPFDMVVNGIEVLCEIQCDSKQQTCRRRIYSTGVERWGGGGGVTEDKFSRYNLLLVWNNLLRARAGERRGEGGLGNHGLHSRI